MENVVTDEKDKEPLTCERLTLNSLYLEGATPTRFGPSPRKRDLGPSFSRMDLKQKQRTTRH